MKYTNLQLAAFVLKVLAMNVRYWYGTFGQKATTSLYNAKKIQYKGHYTKEREAQYKKDIAAGKWVTDCMGLIKWFFWSQNFARDTKYADGYPDISADQCIQSYCSKTGPISTIPDEAGLVLWTNGHIGVSIGGGWAVEARGFAYGVVKTRIKERTWKKWGRLKALSYVAGTVDPTAGGEPMHEPTELGERLLKRGCKGEDVRKLQAALVTLGFGKYLGTDGADGEFGSMTDSAVRAFQKAYKLTVDGEFGPDSLKKLNELLNIETWHEPENEEPLTEDDLPPEDPNAEDEAPDSEEVSEGDATMGSGSVNPYPIPTQVKKQGSKGQTVKWIQWELRQSGFNIGKYGPNKDGIDGDFGADTTKAVKAFQRKHTDATGKMLDVDGEVGPKTREALLAEWDICEHGGVEDTPTPPPATGAGLDCTTQCPDISYYDGKPDWAKVDAPHVWIREGDSLRKRDPEFERNVKGAVKYGIPFSIYLFFRAGTMAEMRDEINTFAKRVKATGHTPLSVVLDVEVTSVTVNVLKAARALLDEHFGPEVGKGMYMAHHLYSKFKSIMELYDYYWVPRYNSWKTPPAHPYHIWQGAFGAFKGIRGGKKSVDCNRPKTGWTWLRIFARRAA